MHEHRIAHRFVARMLRIDIVSLMSHLRDACYFNLMVDPSKLCPEGFHFGDPRYRDDFRTPSRWLERRSVAPLDYYFIDFELAEYFPPSLDNRLCIGFYGQNKNVPEMSLTVPYDPFKLDVFQLGGAMADLVKVSCFLFRATILVDSPKKRNMMA